MGVGGKGAASRPGKLSQIGRPGQALPSYPPQGPHPQLSGEGGEERDGGPLRGAWWSDTCWRLQLSPTAGAEGVCPRRLPCRPWGPLGRPLLHLRPQPLPSPPFLLGRGPPPASISAPGWLCPPLCSPDPNCLASLCSPRCPGPHLCLRHSGPKAQTSQVNRHVLCAWMAGDPGFRQPRSPGAPSPGPETSGLLPASPSPSQGPASLHASLPSSPSPSPPSARPPLRPLEPRLPPKPHL